MSTNDLNEELTTGVDEMDREHALELQIVRAIQKALATDDRSQVPELLLPFGALRAPACLYRARAPRAARCRNGPCGARRSVPLDLLRRSCARCGTREEAGGGF